MQLDRDERDFLWVILPTCLASLPLAWYLEQPALTGVGVIGLVYGGLRHGALLRRGWRRLVASTRRLRPSRPGENDPGADDLSESDALVDQMLGQSRYALLLRPQIGRGLSERQYRRAMESLERGMALVPDGEVVLGEIDEALDDGRLEADEIVAYQGRVVRVEHFFLDRFLVTNGQFRQFVAAGGYEQLSLWDESIWPAVLDFVDRTGRPGPCFWSHGRCAQGLSQHPVVGINWYEAMAYARWAGKRLPTDAEWVKAASWPVSFSATSRLQRRYPWGDTMDRHRANLWGSGPNGTVPVDAFAEGVSVGGIYQLTGNVWEWMRGEFRGPAGVEGEFIFDVPMKSIRGGAFDTYFDNQATCQFQTGEAALARKPNVGFRCALSVCDLLLTRDVADPAEQAELDEPSVAEVQA